jgi:hypothetical protein
MPRKRGKPNSWLSACDTREGRGGGKDPSAPVREVLWTALFEDKSSEEGRPDAALPLKCLRLRLQQVKKGAWTDLAGALPNRRSCSRSDSSATSSSIG